MNPDILLSVVAIFAGFVLKTTLAFAVCLVLSRLVDSPNSRFLIWSALLYGTAAYWLTLANAALAGGNPSPNAAHASLQPATAAVAAWQIPDSWAFPLGLALRAIGIVYLLTVSYMTFAHLRKRWHLRWVLGFTSEPSPEIAEKFRSLAASLHVGRSRLLILSGPVRRQHSAGFGQLSFCPPSVSNWIGPNSKIFCVMNSTTFAAGIPCGMDWPSLAARFFSFIRQPGMQCAKCSSIANSHAIWRLSLTPRPGRETMQKASFALPA